MTQTTINIALETGQKRVFAVALDWPGWCRSGRDTAAAQQALLEYGPRYARVLHTAGIPFEAPEDTAVFAIAEQLPGSATTDFGAPDAALAADARPVADAERAQLKAILQAGWRAFDTAVDAASGRELRKGPRGGGRDLDQIVRHVLEADQAYLPRLNRRFKPTGDNPQAQLAETRQAILEALDTAVVDGLPQSGPRGGKLWTPRYFVRRVAYHTLDHAWEIEDRIL